MNFRGQYKRGRNINLGGKSSASSASSVLKKAQAERARRERARLEERAAVMIQAFYRGKTALFNRRKQAKQEWCHNYMDVTSMSSPDQVRDCIRMFTFCARTLLYDRTQMVEDIAIIEHLDTIVQCNSVEIGRVLPHIALEAFLMAILLLLKRSPDMQVSRRLISITNLLIQFVPESLYASIGDLCSSNPEFFKNLEGQLVLLCSRYPEAFLLHYLNIPRLTSVAPTMMQAAVPVFINAYSDHSHVSVYGKLDKPSRLWTIVNLVMASDTSTTVGTAWLKVLSNMLTGFGSSIEFENASNDLYNGYGDEDDDEEEDADHEEGISEKSTASYVVRDELQKHAIETLYARGFIVPLFNKISMSNDVFDVDLLAAFFVALFNFFHSKRRDILLYLSALSDGTKSAVQIFWQHFKRSGLFAELHEQPPTLTDIRNFDSYNTTWTNLVLTLELYSYWLIIADDSEFSDKKQGLALSEVRELAAVLKNLCFSLIWNGKVVQDLNNALLTGLKSTSLLVVRQIYIRDSRRPFLEKDFWLMTSSFDMEVFIPSVVEEHERLLEKEQEQESESRAFHAPNSITETRRKNSLLTSVAPRLEMLRQVPFFMPFDVRVHIFQAFIELDKTKVERHETENNIWASNPFFENARVKANINRNNLLEDAYEAFHNVPSLDFKLPIAVSFHNEYGPEAGIDGGGLTKEFLTSVCREGFGQVTPDDATTTTTPTNRHRFFLPTSNHQLYPNPLYGISTTLTHLLPEQISSALSYYRFLGRVIGKCLYEGILVDVEFAPFFLQKWASAGRRLDKNTFDDLYSLDPDLYRSLVKLKEYTGDVEHDLALDFTVAQDEYTVELKRGGSDIPVTKANRLEYIHAIANYKLNTVLSPQSNAFLDGIGTMVSANWLSMFNALELQMLVSGGPSKIDIEDLKKNTVYSNGYHRQHPTILAFWEVMNEMSEEDRRKFVRFVTSVPKAPLLGFSRLHPKLALQSAGQDVSRLPTSSTCMNLLKLPDYRDKRLLKEKLLYSIRSEAGFDLS